MKMQKQIKNVVIGLVAALATSFAAAGAAPESTSNSANAHEHGHAARASVKSEQGLSTADWRYVGGEPGWIHEVGNRGSQTEKSRAEVQKELFEFQRSSGAQLRHLSLYIRG